MNDYKINLLKQIGITKTVNNPLELDWYGISEYDTLTEEFMREFKSYLRWGLVCGSQKLSENFIREFEDNMEWYPISRYQKLSEDFIREYQSDVDWFGISEGQQLSDNFIIEFQDKIIWTLYLGRHKVNFDIMKKFITKTNYKELYNFQTSHLTREQKQAISNIMQLKNMFQK